MRASTITNAINRMIGMEVVPSVGDNMESRVAENSSFANGRVEDCEEPPTLLHMPTRQVLR